MKQLSTTAILLAMTGISWGATSSPYFKTEAWAEELVEDVLSARIITCNDWMRPPVISLGSDETLEFSFDIISHDAGICHYHIDHCDADWEKSDLLYSEYMEGFDDEDMEMGEISQNTTFEYTHFSLTFPNEKNSPKLSGNYLLTVTHENIPYAVFRFCVVEPGTEIRPSVTDVTDIDTREAHQQVLASVGTEGLSCIDAMKELKLTVMQNMRFDNAARALSPDFIEGATVSWQHCEPLVFDAGNGFRRFEITDIYANTQNVDKISYYDPYYHATLKPDEIRKSYHYDSDHAGRYIVRSTRNGVTDYDTESDYVFVHFELYTELIEGGSPYIFYRHDGAGLSMKQKMAFRGTRPHCYEVTLPLKMGSYDYQYLWLPDGKNRGETGKIEGNWHSTPNEYLLLLYQHRPGDRYDRLVGYSTTTFK